MFLSLPLHALQFGRGYGVFGNKKNKFQKMFSYINFKSHPNKFQIPIFTFPSYSCSRYLLSIDNLENSFMR